MPSAINSGIPVDSPFNISSGGGMVMPDVFPRKGSGSIRTQHDHNPLSQGYPIKLPPVPELSDPREVVFSELHSGGQLKRSNLGGATSSNKVTFPLADLDSSSSSQLHRQRGLRKKSGTRRINSASSQST